MRTTVHLARHADTVWHAENRYAGVTDVALTDDAPTQAADLAHWARQVGVSAVWSSPLSRARLTATPAAQATARALREHPGLLEVDFGAGEGLTGPEMRDRFGPARAAFEDAPASSPLPGGELGHHAIARARGALSDIVRDAQSVGDTAVLVVAHSTLLRLLLCSLLGFDPNRYRTLFPRLDPAAVTTLGLPPSLGDVQLIALNVPTTRRS